MKRLLLGCLVALISLAVHARADSTECSVLMYFVPEPITACPVIACMPIDACSVPCEPPQATPAPTTAPSGQQPQQTFRAEPNASPAIPARQPTLAPDKEVKKDAGEYFGKLVPTISPRRLAELRARRTND